MVSDLGDQLYSSDDRQGRHRLGEGTLTASDDTRFMAYQPVADDLLGSAAIAQSAIAALPTQLDKNDLSLPLVPPIYTNGQTESSLVSPSSVTAAIPLLTLALVDAATDQVVEGFKDLSQTSSLDLSQLGFNQYSNVALVNPDHPEANAVKSVRFESSTGDQTENTLPYALFGDNKGDMHGRTLEEGTYALKATAYSERGGKGEVLGTTDLSYAVINTENMSDQEPGVATSPAYYTSDIDLSSSLKRKVKTKDLEALKEIYNIAFDQRGKPDVHVGMADSDIVLLKVQQNELIDDGRSAGDFVEEPFDVNITARNVEIVLPNGSIRKPTAVYRKSKVADTLKQQPKMIVDHYYHIKLPLELNSRDDYTIRFTAGNLEDITFRPVDTISLAIHNARVYELDSSVKRAKLSSWMGPNAGGASYQEGTAFRIVNQGTQKVVYTSSITLDAAQDKNTGADVFNIDFSPVEKVGIYRIEVEGIGQSLPFEIRGGVWEDMLDLTLEGLYAHRAFAKLEQPYTSFSRRANSDIVFYQSSTSAADFTFFGKENRFDLLPKTADRSQAIKLTGGWFDAGDFDANPEHFFVINSLVDLYNSNPGYFEQFDPDIPESKDSIPDVLNEALWGIELYKKLQRADGAVSGGFEFDSHPDGTASWEEKEAFIYAPDFWSSHRFAIAAAKLSTALELYDAAEARDLRDRAIRAMDWAEAEYAKLPNTNFSKSHLAKDARQTAAVELYRLTSETKYHDIFRSIGKRHNYEASFTYAQLSPDEYKAVDTQWQSLLRTKLIENGDHLLSFGQKNGFDTLNEPGKNQTWGYNTIITTDQAHKIAMAHQLTGDRKYANALAASMQFGLGMNPDNMAFTTGTVKRGLAYDEPDDVLHSDGRTLDQIPDGITLYGFYGSPWFAWTAVNDATQNTVFNTKDKELAFPLLEAFSDYHNMVPMAEYTIHQTIEDQIFAFGYLAGQSARFDSN